MSILTRGLRVSFNPRLKNKDERHDTQARGEGWQPYELTPPEIAHFIGKGVAYSVQVRDGIRRQKNFIASDLASVDIDQGMRIEDALAHPFCQEHLTILYRTKSHTEEKHRFRLVFALPRTITKAAEQKAVNRALAMRLNGDLSATDAVRICYGSDLQAPEVFDRAITPEVLDQLIAEGNAGPQPDGAKNPNRLASARGGKVISPDLLLKNSDGTELKFKDVVDRASVHCPHHNDEHASAFVKVTESGSRFLHCAVCQTTWWEADKQPSSYDFDAWDRAVESTQDAKFEDAPASSLFPDEGVSGPKLGTFKRNKKLIVHRSANDHLVIDALPKGITFVKSPKGSGKTTTLASIADLRKTKVEFSGADEASMLVREYMDTSFSILLIGHRRALIREMCARLKLNCYLDDDEDLENLSERKRRYGVCLDSLWKVRNRGYDLIIIDESEQVLGHFLSETLEHREGIFSIFHELLALASHVMALDADLSWVTYDTLTSLGGGRSPDSKTERASKPVTVYYNKPQPPNKEILVFRSKDHLLSDFEQQVRDGKKIFLTSNSKTKVDQIASLLRDKHPKVKFVSITSDNSNAPEIQEFIVNIKERIAEYQVVLTSPSLGTGIDITLDPDVPPVDIVYGFFENLVNTHFDIDQQLRRVRHPKEVRVWISPRTFNFETEFAAVRSDLENEKNGLVTMNWGSALLNLAVWVVAMQRASKNKLKKNFVAYKSAQGWTARDVVPDPDRAKEGKESFRLGKNLHLEERVGQLLAAPPIIQGEYLAIRERIDDNDEISAAEMLSFQRVGIEAFYVQEISRELVLLDAKGFRGQVRTYQALTHDKRTDAPWGDAQEAELKIKQELKLLPMRFAIPWLLHTLLSVTPAYKDHQFDPTAIYSASDLQDFIKSVDEHRIEIENLFGKPIPRDLKTKPTSFLRTLLGMVGLKQTRVDKKRQTDGHTTYFYSVDAESLRVLDEVVQRRVDVENHWEFVHELHGLNGALYARNFFPTTSDGTQGVYYLAPVTKGKTVKLKKTERVMKRYGVTPSMEAELKASSKRLAERFAKQKATAKEHGFKLKPRSKPAPDRFKDFK